MASTVQTGTNSGDTNSNTNTQDSKSPNQTTGAGAYITGNATYPNPNAANGIGEFNAQPFQNVKGVLNGNLNTEGAAPAMTSVVNSQGVYNNGAAGAINAVSSTSSNNQDNTKGNAFTLSSPTVAQEAYLGGQNYQIVLTGKSNTGIPYSILKQITVPINLAKGGSPEAIVEARNIAQGEFTGENPNLSNSLGNYVSQAQSQGLTVKSLTASSDLFGNTKANVNFSDTQVNLPSTTNTATGVTQSGGQATISYPSLTLSGIPFGEQNGLQATISTLTPTVNVTEKPSVYQQVNLPQGTTTLIYNPNTNQYSFTGGKTSIISTSQGNQFESDVISTSTGASIITKQITFNATPQSAISNASLAAQQGNAERANFGQSLDISKLGIGIFQQQNTVSQQRTTTFTPNYSGLPQVKQTITGLGQATSDFFTGYGESVSEGAKMFNAPAEAASTPQNPQLGSPFDSGRIIGASKIVLPPVEAALAGYTIGTGIGIGASSLGLIAAGGEGTATGAITLRQAVTQGVKSNLGFSYQIGAISGASSIVNDLEARSQGSLITNQDIFTNAVVNTDIGIASGIALSAAGSAVTFKLFQEPLIAKTSNINPKEQISLSKQSPTFIYQTPKEVPSSRVNVGIIDLTASSISNAKPSSFGFEFNTAKPEFAVSKVTTGFTGEKESIGITRFQQNGKQIVTITKGTQSDVTFGNESITTGGKFEVQSYIYNPIKPNQETFALDIEKLMQEKPIQNKSKNILQRAVDIYNTSKFPRAGNRGFELTKIGNPKIIEGSRFKFNAIETKAGEEDNTIIAQEANIKTNEYGISVTAGGLNKSGAVVKLEKIVGTEKPNTHTFKSVELSEFKGNAASYRINVGQISEVQRLPNTEELVKSSFNIKEGQLGQGFTGQSSHAKPFGVEFNPPKNKYSGLTGSEISDFTKDILPSVEAFNEKPAVSRIEKEIPSSSGTITVTKPRETSARSFSIPSQIQIEQATISSIREQSQIQRQPITSVSLAGNSRAILLEGSRQNRPKGENQRTVVLQPPKERLTSAIISGTGFEVKPIAEIGTGIKIETGFKSSPIERESLSTKEQTQYSSPTRVFELRNTELERFDLASGLGIAQLNPTKTKQSSTSITKEATTTIRTDIIRDEFKPFKPTSLPSLHPKPKRPFIIPQGKKQKEKQRQFTYEPSLTGILSGKTITRQQLKRIESNPSLQAAYDSFTRYPIANRPKRGKK